MSSVFHCLLLLSLLFPSFCICLTPLIVFSLVSVCGTIGQYELMCDPTNDNDNHKFHVYDTIWHKRYCYSALCTEWHNINKCISSQTANLQTTRTKPCIRVCWCKGFCFILYKQSPRNFDFCSLFFFSALLCQPVSTCLCCVVPDSRLG